MSTSKPPKTRRTGGTQAGGRAARVVEGVLRAAAIELGRVGYASLRVEDVAERSGVNKTTIYRRWPTKPALVAGAIRHVKPSTGPPDTGSLRDDFVASLRATVAFARSALGRGLIRTLQSEGTHPELSPIVRALRREHAARRLGLVARAVARGELPASVDATLVADAIFAPVLARVVHRGEKVDDAFLVALVDLVLAGARARR